MYGRTHCAMCHAGWSAARLTEEHLRRGFDAFRRDAAETYLPAFEACVRGGGVSSIMCSYNAVRAAASCMLVWASALL
jgi:beta-glucosidase-like glycosyl hydrolase